MDLDPRPGQVNLGLGLGRRPRTSGWHEMTP